MQRYFILVVLSTLLGSASYAEETKEDTATCAQKIDRTSKFPPIKTGFLVDLDPQGRDGFFYLGLEVFSWKLGKQQFALDVGAASSRVVVGLAWAPWFDNTVGPFIWGGYNISGNSPAWGVGLTVVKL